MWVCVCICIACKLYFVNCASVAMHSSRKFYTIDLNRVYCCVPFTCKLLCNIRFVLTLCAPKKWWKFKHFALNYRTGTRSMICEFLKTFLIFFFKNTFLSGRTRRWRRRLWKNSFDNHIKVTCLIYQNTLESIASFVRYDELCVLIETIMDLTV